MNGADIFDNIIMSVSRNVEDYDKRVDIYADLIPIFQTYGYNLHDCMGVDRAFDCIIYIHNFVDEFKTLTGASEEDAGTMAHASWFASKEHNAIDDATKEALAWTGRPPLEHPGFDDEDDEWPNY